MKLLNLCFAVLLALTFAACGGHNENDGHTHDGDGDHGHDDGHGHDHSGTRHVMGQIDMGDGYRLEVAHIGAFEGGKEVICEVVVKKDGSAIKDANVTCQVMSDASGDVTPATTAKWMEEEGLYDGHLQMPGTLPEDSHLVVRVRHGDGFDKSHEFALKGHDHD